MGSQDGRKMCTMRSVCVDYMILVTMSSSAWPGKGARQPEGAGTERLLAEY
jgi:hypothetical protein